MSREEFQTILNLAASAPLSNLKVAREVDALLTKAARWFQSLEAEKAAAKPVEG